MRDAPTDLESTLTCPACGHTKSEQMPLNACQWFYECEACKTMLTPKHGDCCVFCSFGSKPCPPRQVQGAGCCTVVSGAERDPARPGLDLPQHGCGRA